MKHVTLTCPKCQKIFERNYYSHRQNVKNGSISYCSTSCSMKGTNRAGKWQKQMYVNTFEERFWSRVEKTNSCWNWKGLINTRGYGVCKLAGKNVTVHRRSYIMKNGEIQNQLHVLHKCDNQICVNPDHLFLGTHQDNMKDRSCKSRQLKGSEVHWAKINENDVIRIRELTNTLTNRELAKLFNVSIWTISSIINYRSWKHVLPASIENYSSECSP